MTEHRYVYSAISASWKIWPQKWRKGKIIVKEDTAYLQYCSYLSLMYEPMRKMLIPFWVKKSVKNNWTAHAKVFGFKAKMGSQYPDFIRVPPIFVQIKKMKSFFHSRPPDDQKSAICLNICFSLLRSLKTQNVELYDSSFQEATVVIWAV
jgi:hypothetical protein